MKRNLYYISESLPNSFSGGTAQLGINLLRELKKKYNVIAVNSLSNFYASKDRFIKAKNELKKEKIKYFHLKKSISRTKHHLTIWNFFRTNYYDIKKIDEIKRFLDKIKIKKNDVILCVGSNSIHACNHIKAYKIALFEDVQDQIQIIRTYLSINKYNFIKRVIKILMLKIYFRNYYKFLKKISSNYQIKYTYSPFDQKKLSNNDIKTSVLPCPVKVNISKKKNNYKEKFNISMFSFSISQDYNGVNLLYRKILPKLKKNNLLNKVSLNLVMLVPKNTPLEIQKIVSDENINVKSYNQDILNKTDLLFYPSKYPVGVRSKILFAFSRKWFVATSKTIKKCIPELEDFTNCLMSNNIDDLADKIVHLIKHKKKYQYLKINGQKVLKNYSPKNGARIIINDLNQIINKKFLSFD